MQTVTVLTDVTHGARVAALTVTFVAHALQRLALAVLAHVCLTGVGLLPARAARRDLVLRVGGRREVHDPPVHEHLLVATCKGSES